MKDDNTTIHPARYIFANNLRTIRRLKEISQEDLALDAGLSRAYISDIERGRRSVSIDVMGKIADALDTNLVAFFKKEYGIDDLIQDDYEKS